MLLLIFVASGYLQMTGLTKHIKIRHAEVAIELLFPDPLDPYLYSINNVFCANFVHLACCSRKGLELPRYVPISIRKHLNLYYNSASQELQKRTVNVTPEAIAQWVEGIMNPYTKGITLTAILEITIAEGGSLQGDNILKAVIQKSQTLNCLSHSSEEQLANLLATYIRDFTARFFRNSAKTWDKLALHDTVAFGMKLWSLCTPAAQHITLSERPSLFTAVIDKLEGIEVALCLWVFLVGLPSHFPDFEGHRDSCIAALYFRIEERFLPSNEIFDPSWVVPLTCIVNFLLLAFQHWPNCEFFDLLHSTVVMHYGEKIWKIVWNACDEMTTYDYQLELMHKRQKLEKETERFARR